MKLNKMLCITALLLSGSIVLSGCVKNKRSKYHSIELGYYPQDVALTTLKEELDKQIPNSNDIITYKDVKYKKIFTTPYSDEYNYHSTKLPVDSGEYQYFEIMPIKWRVLNETDEYYYVTSADILFTSSFAREIDKSDEYETIDYKNSYIRQYLNDYIYNDVLECDSSIMKIEVSNQYEYNSNIDDKLETYEDYVTLLSASDIKKEYTFSKQDDLYAFASDYVIAQGQMTYQESPNSFYFASCDYFLRSKTKFYDGVGKYDSSESVYKIDMIGQSKEASVYDTLGIRPCLKINKQIYKDNHSK